MFSHLGTEIKIYEYSSDTTTRTMTQQKLTETLNPTTLSLDRQYSLYSADRSTFQQAAGANLGKVCT